MRSVYPLHIIPDEAQLHENYELWKFSLPACNFLELSVVSFLILSNLFSFALTRCSFCKNERDEVSQNSNFVNLLQYLNVCAEQNAKYLH